MKKVALISDIHSNYQALQAVLDTMDSLGVDSCYCLGDIVGYGPQPSACINALRDYEIKAVQGNHDAAASGQIALDFFNEQGRQALIWTRQQLSEEEMDFLAGLPSSLDPDWGLLVHGSPQQPLYQYVDDPRTAFLVFRLNRQRLFFAGHTHQPIIFRLQGVQVKTTPIRRVANDNPPSYSFTLDPEGRYFFNPGSIGQPRDGDPRASFAVLKLKEGVPVKMTWYRVEYPVEKTEKLIYEYGLPSILGQRLLVGQ